MWDKHATCGPRRKELCSKTLRLPEPRHGLTHMRGATGAGKRQGINPDMQNKSNKQFDLTDGMNRLDHAC